MSWIKNPFSELYPTERIDEDEFVGLFSSSLVNSATNLYGKGNTILEGVQGSGKSMLLALLKPEIRLAYAKNNEKFPIPQRFSNFISCGINLTQDGAKSFSNLRPGKNIREWQHDLPWYFSDYFNFVVIKDLLKSLKVYENKSREDLFGLQFCAGNGSLNLFAKTLAKNDCWFGYLDGVENFDELKEKVEDRLREYRLLLSLNRKEPNETISKTKTMIAVPIFEAAECLKKVGIISEEVNFIVYIDQYEELDHMCLDENDILSGFRKIINQALHSRDDRVSFKIGTRGYAWKHNRDVYDSFVKIEEGRDYSVINIYELLRKKEHTNSKLFKSLCNEVFEKRLNRANIAIPKGRDAFSYVFGRTPTGEEKARIYAGDKSSQVIKLDASWPVSWKEFLTDLSVEYPLSAHLGAAWARQRGKSDVVNKIPSKVDLPWESEEKKYWKKERVQQSLAQIASNRKQAILLFGEQDIIGVSGANILAFLTICQKIWAIYIATSTRLQHELSDLPENLNRNIQSAGIKEASRTWYEKISELPKGEERKKFVTRLGLYLYKQYINDLAMSNPGKTGVSLAIDDLNESYPLLKMLDECTDFSVLDKKDHTTKLNDKRPRFKYYIEPILCPIFKLPFQQTKEPAYFSPSELLTLIDKDYMESNDHHQLGLGF